MNMIDILQVQNDQDSGHIMSLEREVDRTTQRVDAQFQIHTKISNAIDLIEASVVANSRRPVSNREPQSLNNDPPGANFQHHCPPTFPNSLGQAG